MAVNALQVNAETGFLESYSPNLTSFDSSKKVAFLEIANQQAEREEAPNITNICKQMGITPRTFYEHLERDNAFREAWEDVLLKIEDALQRSLIRQGVKGSQGVTAAIFWLKNRFNKRWNDGQQQITLDISQLKNAIGHQRGYIDAELVDNKGITSTPLKDATNLDSKVVNDSSPSDKR